MGDYGFKNYSRISSMPIALDLIANSERTTSSSVNIRNLKSLTQAQVNLHLFYF